MICDLSILDNLYGKEILDFDHSWTATFDTFYGTEQNDKVTMMNLL